MRSFTKVIAISAIVLNGFFGLTASAQSVLDPADPVVNYASQTVPPTDSVIYKWYRTPRFTWNTSSWKAYIINGIPFRLKFPKTYNPTAVDGKKYPMMIFFHGLGEAGDYKDNEFQLYHGGQFFTNSVDNGSFDGYILCMQSTGFWGEGYYKYIRMIVDYMVVNNKLDRFRVTDNGLSAGGQASWEMLNSYPNLISGSTPMSWTSYFYGDPSWVNKLKFTPIWNFQGGLDGAPTPYTSEGVRDAYLNAGGNYKYTLYPDLGHGTWDRAWSDPDFFKFQLSAYAANPWPLFGRTEFCPGTPISTTIGVPPGYDGYEWRRNGTVIPGASANTLDVTDIGTYDARVLKGTLWSEWSFTPVVIKLKGATVTPTITVSGLASKVLPALDGSTTVKLEVPNTYATYDWERVGNAATLSTVNTFTATSAGDYRVKVMEKFGCSSDFSAPFSVIDANGPNKPDPAINLIATTLSKTAIRLDWSDNPSPLFNETNFEVYAGTQIGGPYQFMGMSHQDVRTFTVNGLNANTKYYFKVRAVNNSGAALPSNEASGTTEIDTQAPTAPGNLLITGSTRNSITIGWNASSDDVGVVRYEIYINGVKSYATSGTTFTVSGLQRGSSYNLNVRALDLAGNASPLSNQVTGQALLRGIDYKYFLVDNNLTKLPDYTTTTPVSTGTTANVTLSPRTQDFNFGFLWEGYINIPVAGTYYFRTNSDDGSKLYLGPLNGTGSPYDFSSTATEIVNNDGNHGANDATSVALTLQQGTYPIAASYYNGVGGFNMNVLWSTPQTGGLFTQIPDSAFTDTPLVIGAAPAKPSNLVATAASYKQINLTWLDNSNNETAFEVWRSTNPLTNFATIGQVASATGTGSTISYKDSTLTPNTKYYYRVRAINQFGESDFDRVGQGVDYAYYEQPSFSNLPDFNTLTPVKTGRINNFVLGQQNRADNFAFKFSTTINIPSTAIYTFYSASDDGSKLYIDGFDDAHLLINNDGSHGTFEKYASKMLSPGPHSMYVSYFDGVADNVLRVSISAPGLTKQLIPDSYLGTPYTSATTLGAPASPAPPSNLVASAISRTSIAITWTDNASGETKYELLRSANNNANYLLYATLPANSNSFTDAGLFPNALYYYKVRAVGTSNSPYAAEDSAKTWNTPPVIVQLPANRSAHQGASTVIQLSATDTDGDPLTFTGQNLPAFASLVDNGNKTATLTLHPSAADLGSYNNVRIIASDPNGGSDFTQFNLTVNNNTDPVIGAIANYTLTENDNVSIPLSASDADGNSLTWTVENLPNAFTLTPAGNGTTATLNLNPNFAASGNYTVRVNVTDGLGGYATQIFTLQVNDKNPNVKVYIRVKHDAGNNIGIPWNTVTGATSTNFLDENSVPTTIGLNFPGPYNSGNSGVTTGNNSGVYPDPVLRDYFVFGAPWMPQTASAVLTGLDPARRYNITVLGNSNWDLTPDNGSTNYTVNGQTLSLYVQNNTQNTVTFNNVAPLANGSVTIDLAKGAGASAGYLNSIVLSSSYDDGSVPITPIGLAAQNLVGQGVQLIWQNLAYNETGYEIYRATNGAGPFTKIGTANGADVTTYLDNTVSGATLYYYKIRAISASSIPSEYSSVVSILTLNRLPQVNPITSVTLKNNQTAVVNVSAIDDATDVLTLSASGLPAFATFTDNGDRTGRVDINPQLSSVGVYRNVTITARDNSGATATATFDIRIVDKDVNGIYLNFTDGALAGKPWNNLTGAPTAGKTYTALKDDRDSTWTSLQVNLQDGFTGVASGGMRPGNGREIYPTEVMRTGLYDNSGLSKRIVFSGLSTTRTYNFVFFNSHDDGTTGTTSFTINGITVTLNPTYNINKTVQINGITTSTGTVTVNVARVTGNDNAYLNSMIIESYPTTPATFVGPTELRVTNATRKTVSLQWEDRSNDETEFWIYRSTGGSYAKIGAVTANTTEFIDSDASLSPNTKYFYIVRAKTGTSTLSTPTNVATAYTYAYAVYVNVNSTLNAAKPWNNLSTIPQKGFVWNNFRDETNALTSLGMVETGQWAGMYGAGMSTGNNSGVYPDNVMVESYGLFPGQTGTLKITGLNLTMAYDFTFFASSNAAGDVNVAYTVNGKTVLLNTSMNKTGTVTMYGIVPDSNGEVELKVSPGTLTSQFGLIGALVMQGYNPTNNAAPPSPADAPEPTVSISSVMMDEERKPEISAYPNPFRQNFTMTVTTKRPDKLDVLLYDANGRVVFQGRYGNLNSGLNTITVQPNRTLAPGVYFVKAVLGSGVDVKLIKIVKE